jgi:hypothetical protein
MKNLFILVSICLLVSCKNPKAQNADPVASNAPVREIEKASWLLGEWDNRSAEGSIVETWEKFSDSVYIGKSYFIKKGDTVSSESIRLVQQANELKYIPTVKNQNDGEAVAFKLTSSASHKLIFENPAHDFPQTITYHQLSSDSLVAKISGKIKGEYHEEKFPMRRVK